jgi:DNA-binding response OmpR family regulator
MKKILIIEDDKFLRDLMEKKLLNSDYEVVTAEDGSSGLEMVVSESPDLVLLDILLPTMSGWEVLAKLTQSPKTENVPVVLLTNLGDQNDIERGLKLGVKDYIIKANFTPAEIVEKIKQCLGEA